MPLSQLVPQSAPLLRAAGFQHGFFGRIGGGSSGNYTSLNCSLSVGDSPTCVARNLSKIASHFGLPATSLVTVSQVHGSRVVEIAGVEVAAEPQQVEADGMVSSCDAVALGIRTADCVPVLVGCRTTGAAAAIHAGWRGLVAGVIPNAVARLLAMGAKPDSLVAAIGPHIGVEAFEVSVEVAKELDALAPTAHAVEWKLGARPHVHLGRLATAQLTSCGLGSQQVDHVEHCTFLETNDFFSFRRDGAASGRQLSVIRPMAHQPQTTSRTIE